MWEIVRLFVDPMLVLRPKGWAWRDTAMPRDLCVRSCVGARSRPASPGRAWTAAPGCADIAGLVERTFAWMFRLPPLDCLAHDQRADIHPAFTTLAAAVICLNQIRRFCWVL